MRRVLRRTGSNPKQSMSGIHDQQASVLVSSDTSERVEKLFSMRAFGFGAGVFPFLDRLEGRAIRLVSTRCNVAVDRRVWPVRSMFFVRMSGIFVCLCLCLCLCLGVNVSILFAK